MARRYRKLKKSMSEKRAEKRLLVLEVSCKRPPEVLKALAEEALSVLESPEADDLAKAAARGQLAMSAVVYKFWRFYLPPAVENQFIFESERLASEFAEAAKNFMNVKKSMRNVDGRTYPAVTVNWEQWYSMKVSMGAPIEPVDLVAEHFIRQRNPKKALERLLQDLLLFSMTAEVDFRLADEVEEE